MVRSSTGSYGYVIGHNSMTRRVFFRSLTYGHRHSDVAWEESVEEFNPWHAHLCIIVSSLSSAGSSSTGARKVSINVGRTV